MRVQVTPVKRLPFTLPFLDYLAPEEWSGRIEVGQLVRIPFRQHDEFGVIYSISKDKSSTGPANLKIIEEIIWEKPALSARQLSFLRDMSEFYRAPLSFLLKMNLLPLQARKIKQMTVGQAARQEQAAGGGTLGTRKFVKPILFVYKDKQGKSQYLKKNIFSEGQTFILVPELPAIGELKKLLPEQARRQLIIISSASSDKDLFSDWLKIWRMEKRIVLGTRRALFLPWSNLTDIFLDDEANASYKSWDMAPRFHARDAALFLAQQHGARFHLMSHTPSVETYFFARHNVFSSVAALSPLKPPPRIIDLQNERRSGNYGCLAADLLEKIKQTVNGDVFIFINRLGSGGCVICRDCGFILICPRCQKALNYFSDKNILRCGRCGHEQPMVAGCRQCGGIKIQVLGSGTQSVEREVRGLLAAGGAAGREIVRVDSDSDDLTPLQKNKDKIIIGTQFVWPHLNWRKIKLLIFLDADIPLFVPEYRVVEGLWQSIRDASYRLPIGSVFLIQTSHPSHFVFRSMRQPDLFYGTELKERKAFSYPPFSFLLRLYFGHSSAGVVRQEADKAHRDLAALTAKGFRGKIFSPLEMTPAFAKNRYWQVILIKIPYQTYKQDTKRLVAGLGDDWKVDPNPNTVLGLC